VYIWPLTVLAGGLACPTKMLVLMRKPGSWSGDCATPGHARHAQQLDEAEGGGVEEPAEEEQPEAGMEAAAHGGPHGPGRQDGRDDTDGGPSATAASVGSKSRPSCSGPGAGIRVIPDGVELRQTPEASVDQYGL